MKYNYDQIIKQYIAHLRINLITASHNKVPSTWKENNKVIGYSKLYFIEEGEGVVYVNNVAYHPKPGDIMFIPEGSLHGFSTISNKTYYKYWCHFNATIGSTPVSDFIEIPIIKSIKDNKPITVLFDRLLKYYNSTDIFSSLNAHAALLELLHDYFTIICKDEIKLKSKTTNTKLNQLLVYIENNLDKKITVNTLAKFMSLHPNYLIRLFTTNFGISPIEYLNRQRIEHAKELLAIKDESIQIISDMVGFSSQYYFSSVFKKQTGLSPREYRNLNTTK